MFASLGTASTLWCGLSSKGGRGNQFSSSVHDVVAMLQALCLRLVTRFCPSQQLARAHLARKGCFLTQRMATAGVV